MSESEFHHKPSQYVTKSLHSFTLPGVNVKISNRKNKEHAQLLPLSLPSAFPNALPCSIVTLPPDGRASTTWETSKQENFSVSPLKLQCLSLPPPIAFLFFFLSSVHTSKGQVITLPQ